MATDYSQLSVWLPPATAEELRKVAEDQQRSLSWLIRQAVEQYLEKERVAA